MNQPTTIACPLCDSHRPDCPECGGTGQVPNIFAELRHGRYETAEETAAAEGRPLAEVQREQERAARYIKRAAARRAKS